MGGILQFCFLLIVSLFPILAKEQEPFATQHFIVECFNMPNQDKDISDPFLQIKDSGGNQVFRSPTQDNVLNPTFDPVTLEWYTSELYNLEVRDHDPFGNDDSMGTVAIRGENFIGRHELSNPTGGQIVIRWKYPTQPTTTRTTTTEIMTTNKPTQASQITFTTTTTTPRSTTARCVFCHATSLAPLSKFLVLMLAFGIMSFYSTA